MRTRLKPQEKDKTNKTKRNAKKQTNLESCTILKVSFENSRNLGGIDIVPISDGEEIKDFEIVLARPKKRGKSRRYSTETLLRFLGIVAAYANESDNLVDFIFHHAIEFGTLNTPERTTIQDYMLLAQRFLDTEDLQNANFIKTELEISIELEDGVFVVKPTTLGHAIWLDYILNGTGQYMRCEYFVRFGEPSPSTIGKTDCWILKTHGKKTWCGEACRIAAHRREKRRKK